MCYYLHSKDYERKVVVLMSTETKPVTDINALNEEIAGKSKFVDSLFEEIGHVIVGQNYMRKTSYRSSDKRPCSS